MNDRRANGNIRKRKQLCYCSVSSLTSFRVYLLEFAGHKILMHSRRPRQGYKKLEGFIHQLLRFPPFISSFSAFHTELLMLTTSWFPHKPTTSTIIKHDGNHSAYFPSTKTAGTLCNSGFCFCQSLIGRVLMNSCCGSLMLAAIQSLVWGDKILHKSSKSGLLR